MNLPTNIGFDIVKKALHASQLPPTIKRLIWEDLFDPRREWVFLVSKERVVPAIVRGQCEAFKLYTPIFAIDEIPAFGSATDISIKARGFEIKQLSTILDFDCSKPVVDVVGC